MAYLINGYNMDLMVPFNNQDGYKSARIRISWIDSLSRTRIVHDDPEPMQLVRYAVIGGLMMLVIIGAQNGLF